MREKSPFIGGVLGDKKVTDLTLEDKKIIILHSLWNSGALITPVVTHDFNERTIDKVITIEDYTVCFQILEKEGLIRTTSSPHQKSIFATYITPEGVLEIEKYDKKLREDLRNEEIAELDLISKRRTHKYFKPLLVSTIVTFAISVSSFVIGLIKDINQESKIEELKTEIKKAKQYILTLPQTKKDDSTHTPTTSTLSVKTSTK